MLLVLAACPVVVVVVGSSAFVVLGKPADEQIVFKDLSAGFSFFFQCTRSRDLFSVLKCSHARSTVIGVSSWSLAGPS